MRGTLSSAQFQPDSKVLHPSSSRYVSCLSRLDLSYGNYRDASCIPWGMLTDVSPMSSLGTTVVFQGNGRSKQNYPVPLPFPSTLLLTRHTQTPKHGHRHTDSQTDTHTDTHRSFGWCYGKESLSTSTFWFRPLSLTMCTCLCRVAQFANSCVADTR